MYRNKHILLCILSLLILSILFNPIYSQKKEENINKIGYWLKIKPFESTRIDLRNLYGIGEIGNIKHLVSYDASFGAVSVVYSSGRCNEGFDVPEWTVLTITYFLNDKQPNLKDLLKGIGKYTSKAEHAYGNVTFYNEEMGIEITYQVAYQEIDSIGIVPTTEHKKKYDCALNEKKDEDCKKKEIR